MHFPQITLSDAVEHDPDAELAERLAIERRHDSRVTAGGSKCGRRREHRNIQREIQSVSCKVCGELLILEEYRTQKGKTSLRCRECKRPWGEVT
jgi:RNase P subunit RPR2